MQLKLLMNRKLLVVIEFPVLVVGATLKTWWPRTGAVY